MAGAIRGKERVDLGLIHQGKEPFRGYGIASAFPSFLLIEGDIVERLVGGDEVEDIRFPIEDDGQMVFRVWFQRPDAEIEISRCERDQESGVFLFLGCHGLGVESRDGRGEHDGGCSRLKGGRYVVDEEFIERLLDDWPGVGGRRSKQCASGKGGNEVFHAPRKWRTDDMFPLPVRSDLSMPTHGRRLIFKKSCYYT
jgi:hypothetical protein